MDLRVCPGFSREKALKRMWQVPGVQLLIDGYYQQWVISHTAATRKRQGILWAFGGKPVKGPPFGFVGLEGWPVSGQTEAAQLVMFGSGFMEISEPPARPRKKAKKKAKQKKARAKKKKAKKTGTPGMPIGWG
jgi:hypothetical protein